MKELGEIAAVWRQAERAGEGAILATVVDVTGSSYRRPGGRLLLTRTGQRVGSISGGCLEGDLSKKAWWLTETGAVVRKYDTSADADGPIDFGLGCNGLIHVLIERLRPGVRSPVIESIETTRTLRRTVAVATVIRADDVSLIGSRVCLLPHGEKLASSAAVPSDRAKAEKVHGWLSGLIDLQDTREEEAGHIAYNEALHADAFVEAIAPPPQFWIFGAGDDVLPLVEHSRMLGWRTVVLDGRGHFARADRFPADVAVLVNSLEDPLAGLQPDRWTLAAVMSHSFSQDTAVVRALAPLDLPYVGVLGPKRRSVALLEDAGLSPEVLRGNWHSPVGLDLGGDSPEQVALSIAAEAQAVLMGRTGGKISERGGPIHETDTRIADEAPFLVHPLACN